MIVTNDKKKQIISVNFCLDWVPRAVSHVNVGKLLLGYPLI